jgi:hypothetical protein
MLPMIRQVPVVMYQQQKYEPRFFIEFVLVNQDFACYDSGNEIRQPPASDIRGGRDRGCPPEWAAPIFMAASASPLQTV